MAIFSHVAIREIMAQSLKRKDQNIAAIMDQIGNLLKEYGIYSKVFDMCTNVLKIEKKMLDFNDPEIAITLNNIGKFSCIRCYEL